MHLLKAAISFHGAVVLISLISGSYVFIVIIFVAFTFITIGVNVEDHQKDENTEAVLKAS